MRKRFLDTNPTAQSTKEPPSKERPDEQLQMDEAFDEEARMAPIIAALIGLFTLAIYVRTAFPTVPSGDSGELCFTSCALGVAHPPGYPLFIMTGFLFTKIIPFGSPAFRVNCVSCVCGAAAGLCP